MKILRIDTASGLWDGNAGSRPAPLHRGLACPPPVTTARVARRAAFLLLSLMALLMVGCASLVEEPRVGLASVSLNSIGITGATAQVDLEVENPNRFDLNARSVEYALEFYPGSAAPDQEVPEEEWRTLATGRSAEELSLTGGETTPVQLLVPFSYSELGSAASRLLRDGSLRYRFSGAFTVASPLGDIRVPFDRTGLLDP